MDVWIVFVFLLSFWANKENVCLKTFLIKFWIIKAKSIKNIPGLFHVVFPLNYR